jgi:hypothetical protein
MSEWQPIETAPKDGTWIELWREPTDVGFWQSRVSAKWHRFEDGDEAWVWPDREYEPMTPAGRELADEAIEDGDNYEDAESFTHWRHMPEPPFQTMSEAELLAAIDGLRLSPTTP